MHNAVAEPWTRYEDSLQWRVHHAYYQQRGARAWLDYEIPFQSTSNIAATRRHARMLSALAAARGDTGPIWVLEVGAGSGHFAANFLRALSELDPALAARTRYLASDYSPKSLADLATSRHLAAHIEAGHVVPALFDLDVGGAMRDPAGSPLVQRPERFDPVTALAATRSGAGVEGGGSPLSIGLEPGPAKRSTSEGRQRGMVHHASVTALALPDDAVFSLVIANYVCSAIPMTPLQKDAGGLWSELWVETRERSPDSRVAGDTPEALATRPNALAALPRTSAWEALESDLVGTFGAFHGAVVETACADFRDATVFYPRRFFDFLRSIGPLTPDALLVTCDYGNIKKSIMRGHYGRPPQHYGNSLGQSVMFALFDAFAAIAGYALLRNTHELDNVHIAVVSRGPLGADVRAAFDAGRHLGKNESDTLLDLAAAARHFAARDDQLAAMRCYQACVAIDPDNAQIRYDLSELALTDQRGELAMPHLVAGQALDPDGYDWDFMLGRAHFQCGSSTAARAAYERSLAVGPHPQTWLNLGAIHRDEGRSEEALQCFRAALALDPDETRAASAIALIDEQRRGAGAP